MDKDIALYLSLLTIALMASPALGSYLDVPLGTYNVSLDLGGKAVSVENQPVSDSVTRSVKFVGGDAGDWGLVQLSEYTTSTSAGSPADRLFQYMKSVCKPAHLPDAGTIDGRPALVSYGDARVEHGFGQRCYGAIVPLDDQGVSREIMILGHFSDEAVNKQFVYGAKIVYAGAA
jgi:hypothetical protein